jgi:hypothetical protein
MKSRIALCLVGVSLAFGASLGAAEANAAVMHRLHDWHCQWNGSGYVPVREADGSDATVNGDYTCDAAGHLHIGSGPS